MTPARFERATCRLGGDRSIQLSYGVIARKMIAHGSEEKYVGVSLIRRGSPQVVDLLTVTLLLISADGRNLLSYEPNARP